MSKKLRRSYDLPSGKSLEGMADVLENYFSTISGSSVSKIYRGQDAIDIKCETTSFLQKKLGLNVKITVMLSKHNRVVEVRYIQETDDHIARDIVVSPLPLGLMGLYGASKRSEIPFEISSLLQDYLST